MPDPKFDISIDASRGLLELTPKGQWTMQTIGEFRVALADACSVLAAKGHPAGSLYVLSNSETQGIQAKEITAALEELTRDIEKMTRKVAIVIGGTLQKMQVDRLSASDKIRTFSNQDEAIAWLYA